jgi:hypothetical protein
LALGDFDARRDADDVGQPEQLDFVRGLRLGDAAECVEIRGRGRNTSEVGLEGHGQALADAVFLLRPRAGFAVHD